MRMTLFLLIGVALSFASVPAAAQNAADTNTSGVVADNSAVAGNDIGTAPSDAAAADADANAFGPVDSNTGAIDTEYVEPAPPPTGNGDRRFPWGLLGLLGLLGLIPRLRRGR